MCQISSIHWDLSIDNRSVIEEKINQQSFRPDCRSYPKALALNFMLIFKVSLSFAEFTDKEIQLQKDSIQKALVEQPKIQISFTDIQGTGFDSLLRN